MGREGKVKAVGVEVIEWQIHVDTCGYMWIYVDICVGSRGYRQIRVVCMVIWTWKTVWPSGLRRLT